MITWYNIKEKRPQQKQAVWYFFEYVGLHHGFYEGQDFCDVFRMPDTATPEQIAEHESHRGKCTCNIFYGKSGFLTDDVTHWAVYNEESKVDAGASLIAKLEDERFIVEVKNGKIRLTTFKRNILYKGEYIPLYK